MGKLLSDAVGAQFLQLRLISYTFSTRGTFIWLILAILLSWPAICLLNAPRG